MRSGFGFSVEDSVCETIDTASTPKELRKFLVANPDLEMRGESVFECPLARLHTSMIGRKIGFNPDASGDCAEWMVPFAKSIDAIYGSNKITSAQALAVLDSLFPEEKA